MKIDPYKSKDRYLRWKEGISDGIKGVSKENSDIIIKYLNDMERGINISSASAKGSRSFLRLYSLRERMLFFAKKFEEVYNVNKLTDIKEEQLLSFFADMKSGVIKRLDGGVYKSVETTGKIFKAFWHWHQKVSRKNGIEILDITADLDTKAEKPDWVYLTEAEVKLLCENAKPKYKVLIMFLFDSGIRAPTELINVKVSDLYNNFKELNIREEISKTFGRRIKLMLCSELLKEYVQKNKLKTEDYLFRISPHRLNEYLKRLTIRILGDVQTPAGCKTSQITMYDFRHISCCYWLPRYKSESALKYRFGWKKSDKIHYYSELLGMKDTISEQDILIDVTMTDIEKKLEKSEREKSVMQDRIDTLEFQFAQTNELVSGIKAELLALKTKLSREV